MEVHGRGENPRPDPETRLEEPLWQLSLAGGEVPLYPERPGQPDCAYYLRNGTCGYAERCRYNHPRDRDAVVGAGSAGWVDYPERVGQPSCQYFLKTGNCKYGPSCKYHHPRHGGALAPVSFNQCRYPFRPGEKECSYYLRTGQCKYGSTCKFHHPERSGPGAIQQTAPAFYPTMLSQTPDSSQQYQAVAGWQMTRPSVMPASYMQGLYGNMLFAPGVVSVPGWSSFPPPASPLLSSSAQQDIQTGPAYGLQAQLSPSSVTYTGNFQPIPSARLSSSTQTEHLFPERLGQPECQYYMKTGDCKFGTNCRYHHPPGWSVPKTSYELSTIGLPLRPEAPLCAFYAQYGMCKFGRACKFNHPMGVLSYSPSASSLVDMPVAPYLVGLSAGTLAPSSSSQDLRPEFGTKDSFTSRMTSLEGTSSGAVGSIYSKGSFIPISGQNAIQIRGSSGMGHGGDISSSI